MQNVHTNGVFHGLLLSHSQTCGVVMSLWLFSIVPSDLEEAWGHSQDMVFAIIKDDIPV